MRLFLDPHTRVRILKKSYFDPRTRVNIDWAAIGVIMGTATAYAATRFSTNQRRTERGVTSGEQGGCVFMFLVRLRFCLTTGFSGSTESRRTRLLDYGRQSVPCDHASPPTEHACGPAQVAPLPTVSKGPGPVLTYRTCGPVRHRQRTKNYGIYVLRKPAKDSPSSIDFRLLKLGAQRLVLHRPWCSCP